MRKPLFRVFAAISAALIMLILLVAIASLAGSRTGVASEAAEPQVNAPGKIIARRLITPTFGFNDPLTILSGGNRLLVTGHGACGPGGEAYKLRFVVTQGISRTLTKAIGRIEGLCTGDELFGWEGLADLQTAETFEPGAGQVCGHVIVFTQKGGSQVTDWCKNVSLVTAE